MVKEAMTHVPRQEAELVRAIGRWSMVALAVNLILGSAIFGLPSTLAALIGTASPLAVLIAGAGSGVIVACYAEVASQFTETGGTYLYMRRAFGRLAGLEVSWMALLARLTACAASLNLLVAYLGEFWPGVTDTVPRLILITLFIGTLAAVNYFGVSGGARMSNIAATAKIGALGLVCVVGLGWLVFHPAVHTQAATVSDPDGWLKAMLLLLFAYGGAESALIPMGEARNPRGDVVFALFMALLIITALYSSVQFIVMGMLADPAHSQRPLADVARRILGRPGAVLISLAAVLSVYGFLTANLLTVPRGMFALAERGDFPAPLGAIHPRWRTPYVSIVLFAGCLWLFALFANFSWNVTLSAVARILYYGGVCAAVPVLRRLQPGAATFRLPGGPLFPILGIAICALLLTRVDFSKSVILLITILIALVNWLVVRGRGTVPLSA